MEARVVLEQVRIADLVAATAGLSRFRAKYIPSRTIRRELHTEISRLISLFCLADEANTFILHNGFVGGDKWSPELGDYTAPVWETVVLRSTPDLFEAIPTGPDSTCRLEWAGGFLEWNTVSLELATDRETPATFSVGGALAYTTGFEGVATNFWSNSNSSAEGENGG